MQKQKRRFHSPVPMTLLLLAILTLNTVTTIVILRGYIQKEHIRTLWNTIDGSIERVTKLTEDNQRQLENIALLIEKQQKNNLDSEDIKNILASFSDGQMISDLYLLLPDNRMLAPDGTYHSDPEDFDFQTENKKGSYISHRRDRFVNLEEKLIYHTVPIRKNQKTLGILYGIIRLENQSLSSGLISLSNQTELYLIEGDTGNFLVDTWHNSLSTMDRLDDRKAKKGSSLSKARRELRHGKTGTSVFRSNIAQEYFYFCYKPVGINDWRLAMSVPEPIIFDKMKYVNYTLLFFSIIKFSAIFLYLIWIFDYNRKDKIEKEAQVTQLSYISEIQRMLFDVHQNPEHMQDALEKIGQKLFAKTVFFITLDGDQLKRTYCWPFPDTVVPFRTFWDSSIAAELKSTGSYLTYHVEQFKNREPEVYSALHELHIDNFMLTLVKESHDDALGILGAWDMEHHWEDTRYLRYVIANFSLACQNIRSHERIDEMASIDTLTGLLNRNSHEAARNRFAADGAELPNACIYMDVNGLHEMNNTLGHSAGDEMLRFVAAAFQHEFGRTHTYRIGGDEFLAFVFDISEEEAIWKIKTMSERIEGKNYHVSIGMDYSGGIRPVDAMTANAEQNMYAEKRRYYERLADKEYRMPRTSVRTSTDN